MSTEVYFDLDRDDLTGGLQLSINDGNGGYRIVGPKFSGSSKRLQHYRISERDAEKIKEYLDCAFPRDATIRELRVEIERLASDMERLSSDVGLPWPHALAEARESASKSRALLARLAGGSDA